jgi:urate oxidase
MPVVLGANNYGKSEVRLVKVDRGSDRHELHDLTVDVALSGDFEACHVSGDNSGLLATDTMRNTVYALARRHPVESPEAFASVLARHFLDAGPSVTSARVRIVEHPWARLGSHPHAFERASGGEHVATVTGDGTSLTVEAGIDDLLVLKTTGSGWEGFLREQYTSLKETSDRIMATVVTARWTYRGDAEPDYGRSWEGVRATVLDAFGDHYSPSVQFTLYRMGDAVLEAHPEVERIHFSLPNKHHLLYDLSRFGLDNPNEIFHATSEPYGLIEGTVERSPVAAARAGGAGVGLAGRGSRDA